MTNEEVLKSIVGKTIKTISDIKEDDYSEIFRITFTDDNFIEIKATGGEGGYFVLYNQDEV